VEGRPHKICRREHRRLRFEKPKRGGSDFFRATLFQSRNGGKKHTARASGTLTSAALPFLPTTVAGDENDSYVLPFEEESKQPILGQRPHSSSDSTSPQKKKAEKALRRSVERLLGRTEKKDKTGRTSADESRHRAPGNHSASMDLSFDSRSHVSQVSHGADSHAAALAGIQGDTRYSRSAMLRRSIVKKRMSERKGHKSTHSKEKHVVAAKQPPEVKAALPVVTKNDPPAEPLAPAKAEEKASPTRKEPSASTRSPTGKEASTSTRRKQSSKHNSDARTKETELKVARKLVSPISQLSNPSGVASLSSHEWESDSQSTRSSYTFESNDLSSATPQSIIAPRPDIVQNILAINMKAFGCVAQSFDTLFHEHEYTYDESDRESVGRDHLVKTSKAKVDHDTADDSTFSTDQTHNRTTAIPLLSRPSSSLPAKSILKKKVPLAMERKIVPRVPPTSLLAEESPDPASPIKRNRSHEELATESMVNAVQSWFVKKKMTQTVSFSTEEIAVPVGEGATATSAPALAAAEASNGPSMNSEVTANAKIEDEKDAKPEYSDLPTESQPRSNSKTPDEAEADKPTFWTDLEPRTNTKTSDEVEVGKPTFWTDFGRKEKRGRAGWLSREQKKPEPPAKASKDEKIGDKTKSEVTLDAAEEPSSSRNVVYVQSVPVDTDKDAPSSPRPPKPSSTSVNSGMLTPKRTSGKSAHPKSKQNRRRSPSPMRGILTALRFRRPNLLNDETVPEDSGLKTTIVIAANNDHGTTPVHQDEDSIITESSTAETTRSPSPLLDSETKTSFCSADFLRSQCLVFRLEEPEAQQRLCGAASFQNLPGADIVDPVILGIQDQIDSFMAGLTGARTDQCLMQTPSTDERMSKIGEEEKEGSLCAQMGVVQDTNKTVRSEEELRDFIGNYREELKLDVDKSSPVDSMGDVIAKAATNFAAMTPGPELLLQYHEPERTVTEVKVKSFAHSEEKEEATDILPVVEDIQSPLQEPPKSTDVTETPELFHQSLVLSFSPQEEAKVADEESKTSWVAFNSTVAFDKAFGKKPKLLDRLSRLGTLDNGESKVSTPDGSPQKNRDRSSRRSSRRLPQQSAKAAKPPTPRRPAYQVAELPLLREEETVLTMGNDLDFVAYS
jgi:hypothetical protein